MSETTKLFIVFELERKNLTQVTLLKPDGLTLEMSIVGLRYYLEGWIQLRSATADE